MFIRNAVLISLVMIISMPAWSGEKSRHKASRGPASIREKDPELNRIYEVLIRDSKKQLTPSYSGHSFSLAAPKSHAYESPLFQKKSDQHFHLTAGSHSAMPWAAEGNLAGASFSVK